MANAITENTERTQARHLDMEEAGWATTIGNALSGIGGKIKTAASVAFILGMASQAEASRVPPVWVPPKPPEPPPAANFYEAKFRLVEQRKEERAAVEEIVAEYSQTRNDPSARSKCLSKLRELAKESVPARRALADAYSQGFFDTTPNDRYALEWLESILRELRVHSGEEISIGDEILRLRARIANEPKSPPQISRPLPLVPLEKLDDNTLKKLFPSKKKQSRQDTPWPKQNLSAKAAIQSCDPSVTSRRESYRSRALNMAV